MYAEAEAIDRAAEPAGAGSRARPSDRERPYFEIANLEIPILLHSLPRSLKILDVGCGSGVHGAELRRCNQHRVVGVDISPESIQKASGRLESAHVADVTRPDTYPFEGRGQFDVILFSDILEHLCDPASVLRDHLSLLKPGGCVVVSIPNVAIWSVRLSLLFGRFRYQDTGTLDRTHLRFFDRNAYYDLLDACGLTREKTRITPGILRPFVPLIKTFFRGSKSETVRSNSSSIMDSTVYKFYCRFVYPIERLICRMVPGLLAFQFVSICHLKEPAALTVDVRYS